MASKRQTAKRKTSSRKNVSKRAVKTIEHLTLGQETFLLATLCVCILLFLSGFGIGGRLTDSISEVFFGIFGLMGYAFPIMLFFGIFFIVAGEDFSKMLSKMIACIVVFLSLCVFLQIFVEDGLFQPNNILGYYSHCKIFKSGGGVFGGLLCHWLTGIVGKEGCAIVCIILIVLSLMIITRKSFFKGVSKGSQKIADSAKKEAQLHKKKAEIRKEHNYKRKQDDIVYKQKERELQYRVKQQKREQHLQDLEYKRQMEARRARQRSMERAAISRDTDFKVTDLRRGLNESTTTVKPANSPEKTTRISRKNPVDTTLSTKATRKTSRKKLDVEPMGRVGVEEVPFMPEIKKPQSDFTITRGGQTSTANFEEPTRIAKDSDRNTASSKMKDSSMAATESATRETNRRACLSKEESSAITNQVADEIQASKASQDMEQFQFPPLTLLQKGNGGAMGDSDEALRQTAQKLESTLRSFGVKASVLDVSCGPAVTRYELQPETGVKVSKIVGLTDDIKLNLAAPDIRIEAPIPGKAAVGIEVPNTERAIVYLRELLESPELKKHKSLLAFPAGKDISGKVIVSDLAKMPHMLVAGTTGSGKSVFTNSIILSMLFRAKPSEVRLIIIDPKVVEFGVYNGIPHLMIPVVTDPKKAAGALNWAVAEMSERYKKFSNIGVRDINSYNERVESLKNIPVAEDEVRPEKMPKIVIVIDELADLMMVAAKEVEDAICRLAQLARAAGIHMIIATQRPSVDVVTGLIKANVPSRVALSVASGVDSRTILDMNGAEKLLGNGDMLFYPSGLPKPIRLQGAWVTDDEVGSIIRFLKEQNQSVVYNKDIEEKMNNVQLSSPSGGASSGGDDRDEYFADAGKFIIEKDKASIGMLQRVLKIGFNRAARIMDQLAEAGVVGEEEGTKPRKVLMSMSDFENLLEEIP